MVRLNAALGSGGEIIGSTKISYYVIIGIDPSVCHGFGFGLHTAQLSLRAGMPAVLVCTNPSQTLGFYSLNPTCLVHVPRLPPDVPVGLWWNCSNNTKFINLVKMSFPPSPGGLQYSAHQGESFFWKFKLGKWKLALFIFSEFVSFFVSVLQKMTIYKSSRRSVRQVMNEQYIQGVLASAKSACKCHVHHIFFIYINSNLLGGYNFLLGGGRLFVMAPVMTGHQFFLVNPPLAHWEKLVPLGPPEKIWCTPTNRQLPLPVKNDSSLTCWGQVLVLKILCYLLDRMKYFLLPPSASEGIPCSMCGHNSL